MIRSPYTYQNTINIRLSHDSLFYKTYAVGAFREVWQDDVPPKIRYLSSTSYTLARQAGGLEGRRPAKNHSFLLVVAGFAGNHEQKIEISGRQRLPEPLQRVGRVSSEVAPLQNPAVM